MAVTFLTNEDKKLIDVEIEKLSKENERLSEEVNALKGNGTGNGLTTEMVTALDNMFKVCAYSKEDISEEYGAFRKAFGLEEEPTPDEPVEPLGIVWSETPEYAVSWETGEVIAGNDYVSEPFSVESGYVYELATPAGGSWNTVFVYDLNGNFKYFKGNPGSTGGKGTLYFDGFENQLIRLSVHKESDELDLSTVVPVKTDRIWSVNRYFIDSSTGVITLNERNNYMTLLKIPVEGGATYKLSTSGTHQWLSWYEYTTDGVYIGIKGNTQNPKEIEATVDEFATYVILTVYGGETPCDNYITFVKTADATGTVEPVDTIWCEGKYIVNINDGTFTETNESVSDYLTEKISVEGGATYKLRTLGTHKWLKWLEYSEDGSYLGYKGNLESPKELEATVHTNATHVILAMSFGENNVSDYATFAKTADVPQEPIVPTTGLVYELAEPKTFNGTGIYIDTGVKLYNEDKNFEIMLEFEQGEIIDTSGTLLHCMYEASPWQGLTIKHNREATNKPLLLTAVGTNQVQNNIPENGVTRLVLVKNGVYFVAKVMHEGIAEPSLVAEGTVGYRQYDGNLLIGAYQDTSGTKGRFWNGTISKCKVYVGDLQTDEETNAFLMGEV